MAGSIQLTTPRHMLMDSVKNGTKTADSIERMDLHTLMGRAKNGTKMANVIG